MWLTFGKPDVIHAVRGCPMKPTPASQGSGNTATFRVASFKSRGRAYRESQVGFVRAGRLPDLYLREYPVHLRP